MAAANLAAATFVTIAFFGIGTRAPYQDAVEAMAIALLFSFSIGTPCTVLLPRVAPVLWRRLAFPFNWAALIVVMFALAVAGSALTIGILAAIGYVPAAAFGAWFGRSIRYAVITTLTFGIAISAYEMLRARLEQTTLALRTRERDEAEARRLAAEAQLASLEARVQPHFLFNTLNAIASLIPADPRSAEAMTWRLASLLRSSLDTGSPLVRVAAELDTVRDYLEIERVRFGDRLRYTMDLHDNVRDATVPRMAVQTLVENAVKYAISPRRGGGTIAVRAGAAAGGVRIEVEDDGPGFDPSAGGDGHGHALVRSRLALLYGEPAKMWIESRPGRTIAVIELPASPD